MARTCIVLLGTHSTSLGAFTRMLGSVEAAVPQRVRPAKRGHDRAPLELEALAELNDRLMQGIESRRGDRGAISYGHRPTIAQSEFERPIREAIRAEFGDADLIILNDPRISHFVPLYSRTLDQLGYQVVFLHILCDPQTVEASVAKHDGMGSMQAMLFWMADLLDAEVATRGKRRAFVAYDALVRDWRRTMDSITTMFSIPPRDIDPVASAEMDAFFALEPLHPLSEAPLVGVPEGIPEEINRIRALFGRLASDPSDADALAGLDSARRELVKFSRWADNVQEAESGNLGANNGRCCKSVERPLTRAMAIGADNTQKMLVDAESRADASEARLRTMAKQLQAARAKELTTRSQLYRTTEQWQDVLSAAQIMDADLRKARKHPLKLFGKLFKFRILRLLAKDGSPLPAGLKRRLAKSAAKVNPRRAMLGAHLAGWGDPSSGPSARKGDVNALKSAFRAEAEHGLSEFLASDERIQFAATAEPSVTIILVLWNQAGLTLNCLRSLEAEYSVPFEVIVVDNYSTDRTRELLERVDNVVVLAQSENLGFLAGVNRALDSVRGGHVLLLNNDATLRPGCLAAAYDAMESSSDIGAVGGPIVLPDGSLQEAGSIIWADGSCLGYGRGDNPLAGPYNFRRVVDYCSGAFLLIREGLFQKLGGFDTNFAPAYYEEVDLCMQISRLGKKVIFEPRAVIDHFEFASSEKIEQALKLQKINQKKFVDKHRDQLNGHFQPSPSVIIEARSRDRRERILFIEDRVPLIAQGSGLPRANEILRLMSEEGYFVTFFPTNTPTDTWDSIWSAVPTGVEVAMGWGITGLEQFLEQRKGYYQQIFVSRPHNMKALAKVRVSRPELFDGVRITYDAEALFSARDAIKAKLFGDTALAARAVQSRASEFALVAMADRITAVTQLEADQFAEASGKPARVLGFPVRPEPSPAPFDMRQNILFVGRLAEDDTPNVDSVLWYVNHVQPLLRDHYSLAQPLIVAGNARAPSMLSLSPSDVRSLGIVDDLRPIFDRARVFVAPTRYAAGIPLKVLQAAAYGVPVVATSLLARQLGWSDGEDLLVGDEPEAFAKAVERLYTDSELWGGIRENALKRIAEDCNYDHFRAMLRKTLDRPTQLY